MDRLTVIHGDCVAEMRNLPAESVHLWVTSPPYWGLRDYKIPPSIWGGDENCAHEWGSDIIIGPQREDARKSTRGNWCAKCNAWRGVFGLEPTPELYLEHAVLIFREAKRVLRKDGCLFVNIGDSYATGGGAVGKCPGGGKQGENCQGATTQANRMKLPGLKTGDLVGIPWRFALALQADGWTLRRDVIWAKPGPMPESLNGWRWEKHRIKMKVSERAASNTKHGALDIGRKPHGSSKGPSDQNGNAAFHSVAEYTECPGCEKCAPNGGLILRKGNWRCTTAHEYVFQFSKSDSYFCDAEAAREKQSAGTHERFGKNTRYSVGPKEAVPGSGIKNNSSYNAARPSMILPSGRNLRSVWRIPTKPFRAAHFACVDDQTEALTETGWKFHSQITDGDKIAAYDERGYLIFRRAKVVRYPFDGQMVAIEKRDSSQRLTEQHRCLVRMRTGRTKVVEAARLKPGMEFRTTAQLVAPLIQAGPSESVAALLGWYLTEGERRRGRTIRINQSVSANPQKVLTIRTLLCNVAAEFTERVRERLWRGRPSKEVTFVIRGAFAEQLYELSPDKEIDLAWLRWNTVSLLALLNAIIDGDGHRRLDCRACVIQKSKPFLDAFQILALRLGWRTLISERNDGCYALYITTGQWLTLRSTNGKHQPIGREYYKGVVWCPSVPGGFWLARRNGKTFITGNTFPPDLVRPIIAAASPVKCCAKCGAPWAPVVERGEANIEQQRACGGDLNGSYNGTATKDFEAAGAEDASAVKARILAGMVHKRVVDHRATCRCNAAGVPAVVGDMFGGSGTVGQVALELGRAALLIELSVEYQPLIQKRCAVTTGMAF